MTYGKYERLVVVPRVVVHWVVVPEAVVPGVVVQGVVVLTPMRLVHKVSMLCLIIIWNEIILLECSSPWMI